MDSRRTTLLAAVAGGLLLAGATGCASSALPEADAGVSAAAASSAAPATRPVVPRAAPDNLAPDGAAPGGRSPVEEGETPPAVQDLADAAGCIELEPQAHVPAVDEQASCRRGNERVYLMTFLDTEDRDTYLTEGPQVVPGGFNVVGQAFVVHVPSAATAQLVSRALHGEVRTGA